MLFRSVVVTSLLIVTALGGVAGPTSAVGARAGAPRASGVPPKVLILGDSYSAGTGGGAYDQPDYGCHRSANTWGQVLGQSLGAVVVNRACHGAVTENIVVTGGKQQGLNTYESPDFYATKAEAKRAATAAGCTGQAKPIASDPYGVIRANPKIYSAPIGGSVFLSGWVFTCAQSMRAQLDWVDASYDLIVLTIGGNDAGFGDIVQNCLIMGLRSVQSCGFSLLKAQSLLSSGALAAKIANVIGQIQQQMSPTAQIVIADYPYLIQNKGYAFTDCIVLVCTTNFRAGAALYQLEDTAKQALANVAAQQSVRVGTTDCGYDSVVFASGVKDAFSGHETVAPLTTDDNADRWINPVKIDTSFTGSIMAPFDASAHPKPAGYRAFATAARQALDNSGCTNHITPGLSGASQIATGQAHSCALVAGGTVKCWGWNYYGQLGDGTTTDRWTPVSVVASREPGTPVNVSASRSGATVNVSWSAPSSGADSYTIEAQYITVLPSGPPVISAWTTVSTTTSTSYAVSCPGQPCSVRVRSFNQYGGSDYVTVGPF